LDYLYIDMNCIIYKCVRDEGNVYKDLLFGKQKEEVWLAVFKYLNFIIDYINPKKMIFFALDGPAPRAKQN